MTCGLIVGLHEIDLPEKLKQALFDFRYSYRPHYNVDVLICKGKNKVSIFLEYDREIDVNICTRACIESSMVTSCDFSKAIDTCKVYCREKIANIVYDDLEDGYVLLKRILKKAGFDFDIIRDVNMPPSYIKFVVKL